MTWLFRTAPPALDRVLRSPLPALPGLSPTPPAGFGERCRQASCMKDAQRPAHPAGQARPGPPARHGDSQMHRAMVTLAWLTNTTTPASLVSGDWKRATPPFRRPRGLGCPRSPHRINLQWLIDS